MSVKLCYNECISHYKQSHYPFSRSELPSSTPLKGSTWVCRLMFISQLCLESIISTIISVTAAFKICIFTFNLFSFKSHQLPVLGEQASLAAPGGIRPLLDASVHNPSNRGQILAFQFEDLPYHASPDKREDGLVTCPFAAYACFHPFHLEVEFSFAHSLPAIGWSADNEQNDLDLTSSSSASRFSFFRFRQFFAIWRFFSNRFWRFSSGDRTIDSG